MSHDTDDTTMSLDDAKKYLQDASEFLHFDEALSVVKAAGETDFLKSLGLVKDTDINNEKRSRATNFYARAQIAEDYKGMYAVADYLDSDQMRIEADEVYKEYAKRNNITISDDDSLAMNIRSLTRESKEVSLEDVQADPQIKSILDSLDVADDDKDFAIVTDKDRQEYLAAFFEATKQDIIVTRSADKEYLFKKQEDKKKDFLESLKRQFSAKLLVSVGASNEANISEALLKMKNAKKKASAFERYKQGILDKISAAVGKGERVQVNKGQLINGIIESQQLMEGRAKLYEQLGYTKSADALKKQNTSFVAKMKSLFGAAYEMRHAVADNMKNNRYKYMALAGASLTVSLVTPHVSATKASIIAAGYATFLGTGAYVWPLIEKREALLREAQKKNDTDKVAQLKALNLWKRDGRKAIKDAMSKEEKARYNKRALINSGIGLVGGLLIGAASFIGQEAGAAALVTSRLMRVGGNLGLQTKFTIEDHKAAKKLQTEESRKKSLMSKIGLAISAAVAIVSEAIGMTHSGSNSHEGNPNHLFDQQEGQVTEQEVTEQQVGQQVTEKPVVEEQQLTPEELAAQATQEYYDNYEVPTEYSSDLGISRSEWNFLHRIIGGVYSTTAGAEHFGTDVTDSQALYDAALRNVATYMHEHPKVCEGQTPIKVLHDVLRRHILSVEGKSDGDEHLVGKMVGEWHYGNSAFDKDMNAWFKIICNGYNADVPADADLEAPLANLQQDLAEAARSGNGNRAIGWNCEQTAFIRGAVRHHGGGAPVIEEEPQPEEVVVPTQQTVNDEQVNEDVASQQIVNDEQVNEDKPKDYEWSVEEGATSRGQNVHPNDIKPGSGNHVKETPVQWTKKGQLSNDGM